ncbi:MAG: outer membrane beta-barrel protein [Gemmatimonadetes bacterium]|nr:outer membrane beta-barrel protein [Gemmatimonadota bacterium]
MKKLVCGILLSCAALAAPAAAAAQSPVPFAAEGRVGVAFPSGDLDRLANSGVGFGATLTVQLMPNYGLYGGYSRTEFEMEGAADARAIDSGFAVGLTAAYPWLGTRVMPWLGTGLLFHDLEVRGLSPAEGSSEIGWELGGGLAVVLAPRVRLTPGISLRTYAAPLPGRSDGRVSYATAGVGLNVAF